MSDHRETNLEALEHMKVWQTVEFHIFTEVLFKSLGGAPLYMHKYQSVTRVVSITLGNVGRNLIPEYIFQSLSSLSSHILLKSTSVKM